MFKRFRIVNLHLMSHNNSHRTSKFSNKENEEPVNNYISQKSSDIAVRNWIKTQTKEPISKYFNEIEEADVSDVESSCSSGSSLFFEALIPISGKTLKDTKYHHCYFCKSILPDHYSLQEHMSVHTKETPYICKFCPKSIPSSKRSFRNREKYTKHLDDVHKQDFQPRTKCYLCSASFELKKELKPHLTWHNFEKNFKCTLCNQQSFETYKQFKEHFKKIHSEIQRPFYTCTFCPKRLNSPEGWRVHEKRHLDESQFLCYFCGKKFHVLNDLEIHISTMHTTELKPSSSFSCYFCSKNFRSRQKLNTHMSIHTMEKAYRCEYKYCRKSFRLQTA